jgi:acetyltransferase-like isoleucine patch superfamily enzyme
MNIENKLSAIESIVQSGLDEKKTYTILDLINATHLFPKELFDEFKLYDEYLPQIKVLPLTMEQKFLHLLWEIFDKLPLSLITNFAVPFRRILAQKLFKKCGKNFIAMEGVRFNFGHNIEVGDDVFLNREVFLDGKGGITLGNFVTLTEKVEIYTHSHLEYNHGKRIYAPVKVEDFAKVFSHSMLLPGIVVGEQAVVAARSVVTKSVDSNTFVAGIPAKPIRERKNRGRSKHQLGHVWFHNAAFQE